MEVNRGGGGGGGGGGGSYTKIAKKKNERGRKKGSKKACGGKMNGHAGIYRVQNIHCFTTAKVSTQRRRVSTQQRRDLRCCVPESGQRATQRRRVLRRCGLERYTVKMLC